MTILRNMMTFVRLLGGYARGVGHGLWLRLKDFHVFVWASFSMPRETLAPPAGAVPATFFGMHVDNSYGAPPAGPEPDVAWPAVEFGARRLWDCGLTWAELEPAAGDWRWSRFDMILASCAARGVEPMLTLGGTPAWAAKNLRTRMNGGGWASMPAHLDDWASYVQTVAGRAKGIVRQYEIWNEPELINFDGGPAGLAALAAVMRPIIRKIDPTALVVSPGFSEDVGVRWLAGFLDAGGGLGIDVAGHHFYLEPRGPEGMVPLTRAVRRLLDAHRLPHVPIWNTEAGWLCEWDEPSRQDQVVFAPLTKVAGYLARMYVLSWALGLERFYWYTWNGGPYAGMLDETGAPNPLATAYAETRRWLLGATMLSCASDRANVWRCAVRRADGSPATIAWCPAWPARMGAFGDPHRTLAIEAPHAYARDLLGVEYGVGKGSLTAVGVRPLLFHD